MHVPTVVDEDIIDGMYFFDELNYGREVQSDAQTDNVNGGLITKGYRHTDNLQVLGYFLWMSNADHVESQDNIVSKYGVGSHRVLFKFVTPIIKVLSEEEQLPSSDLVADIEKWDFDPTIHADYSDASMQFYYYEKRIIADIFGDDAKNDPGIMTSLVMHRESVNESGFQHSDLLPLVTWKDVVNDAFNLTQRLPNPYRTAYDDVLRKEQDEEMSRLWADTYDDDDFKFPSLDDDF